MAKSKLDAYKDLLGDMTDEKLVELTGYKIGTVQKYRAKHADELEKAVAEVSELTGVDPSELEEAPEDVAELKASLADATSEEHVRSILSALLDKHDIAVTDKRIDALLDTDSLDEATALVMKWKDALAGVEHLLAEPEASPVPKSFATKRTVVITTRTGTMKIGMSEFFGERAAAVWAMLSEDDRRDLTKDHVY